MGSLIKHKGRYSLQFFDEKQTPPRKWVSLRTRHKRAAVAKQRELEADFVIGLFEP